MSVPPKVILLDSNAYFRLARSIQPLLAGTFGEPPGYSFYVLDDLDDEYFTSSRLQTKFEWVNAPEFVKDRKGKRYGCRGKLRKQVDSAYSFLAAYAAEKRLNVSREDVRILAVASARTFPVVSDDHGMHELAKAFDIEIWSAIKLLKFMVTNNRIDMDKVQEVIEYLNAENDLPMSRHELQKQYREYFHSNCPI